MNKQGLKRWEPDKGEESRKFSWKFGCECLEDLRFIYLLQELELFTQTFENNPFSQKQLHSGRNINLLTLKEQDGHQFGPPRKGPCGIRHLLWNFCWWALMLIMASTQNFSNIACVSMEHNSSYLIPVTCFMCCFLSLCVISCIYFMHILRAI